MTDDPKITLSPLHITDDANFADGLELLARGGLGSSLRAVVFSSGIPTFSAFLCSEIGSRSSYFFSDGRPNECEATTMFNKESWKDQIYFGVSQVVHAIRRRSSWDIGVDYSSALLARPGAIIIMGGHLKTQPQKHPINLYIPAATGGHDQLEDFASLEAEYPGRFHLDFAA